MRAAFSDALVAAAMADPKVVLLTGDHGYALFDAFRKACPAQYINCGVAEQNMVGVAAGLAKAGFRPFVYGLAAFVPIRVLEQIKIDVCYENLPVILIGDGAGLVYSHLGTSHQSTEDIACTRALPELTVLSPADRFEMTACMTLALQRSAPVYMRMGKSDCGDVHAQALSMTAGEVLKVRSGNTKLALLATGSMVSKALAVCAQGLDAEVWSVPCIKPLSALMLTGIAARMDGIVTLEEHSTSGGLGSCVTELLSQHSGVPVLRLGIEDRFSSHCGSWDYLLTEHGLDLDSVTQRISAFSRSLSRVPGERLGP